MWALSRIREGQAPHCSPVLCAGTTHCILDRAVCSYPNKSQVTEFAFKTFHLSILHVLSEMLTNVEVCIPLRVAYMYMYVHFDKAETLWKDSMLYLHVHVPRVAGVSGKAKMQLSVFTLFQEVHMHELGSPHCPTAYIVVAVHIL